MIGNELCIINFGHPLTESNLEEIKRLAGCGDREVRVLDVPSQVNPGEPFEPQVENMLESLGLAPEEWQTRLLLFNLPSLNCSAAVLLAMLHGRLGYFPPVLRLRPDNAGFLPRFVVAEILNLQAIRERARGKR